MRQNSTIQTASAAQARARLGSRTIRAATPSGLRVCRAALRQRAWSCAEKAASTTGRVSLRRSRTPIRRPSPASRSIVTCSRKTAAPLARSTVRTLSVANARSAAAGFGVTTSLVTGALRAPDPFAGLRRAVDPSSSSDTGSSIAGTLRRSASVASAASSPRARCARGIGRRFGERRPRRQSMRRGPAVAGTLTRPAGQRARQVMLRGVIATLSTSEGPAAWRCPRVTRTPSGASRAEAITRPLSFPDLFRSVPGRIR